MIHTETVHPSQLRRAMAGYAAQGYPPHYGPHPSQVGMMVIVISLPDAAPIPDWQYAPPPARRHWRLPGGRRLTMLACVLVIAGSLGYIAYGMFAGAAPTQAAQATPEPSLWDRVAGVLPQPHGESSVERTAPAIELPWDVAGRQVGEAAAGIGRILAALFTLLVLGGLTFVALKVRGMVRK